LKADTLSKIQFEQILKTHPNQGCYLLMREEWKIIEADLGSQEDKYVPQILPKLKGRVFWSSSVCEGNSDLAFRFSGGYSGGVGTHFRSNPEALRCGCSAESE